MAERHICADQLGIPAAQGSCFNAPMYAHANTHSARGLTLRLGHSGTLNVDRTAANGVEKSGPAGIAAVLPLGAHRMEPQASFR